jgi:LPS export ABC transporter protein LptC
LSPRRIAKALAGFGLVAVIALILVTVWVVRHRTDARVLQTVADIVPGALLHAHNFHWTQMKSGDRQWVLTAAEASYSNDRHSLTLKDAKVEMTSTDGKSVAASAPLAVMTLDGNHVKLAKLSGGTTIRYGDFVLTTDSATFKPDEDEVDAAGLVTVIGEGMRVTGMGLTGHPKARVFQLRDQVNTQFIPKSNRENAKAG